MISYFIGGPVFAVSAHGVDKPAARRGRPFDPNWRDYYAKRKDRRSLAERMAAQAVAYQKAWNEAVEQMRSRNPALYAEYGWGAISPCKLQ